MACFIDEFDRAKEALKRKAFEGWNHWVVAFSGGKDSTSVLIIALEAALEGPPLERLDIVYCDTGVEMPPVRDGAVSFLEKLRSMEKLNGLPLHFHHLRPRPEESFWVCLLGRGYPPPHRLFRWCTRRLKILPVRRALDSIYQPGKSMTITGVRFGESADRNYRLGYACGRGGECGHGVWFQEGKRMKIGVMAPIAYWSECMVWDFLKVYAPALEYDVSHLGVYLGRRLRFGCWMCTVVKEDKALEAIASQPQWAHLKPLLSYRHFVKEVASNPSNRLPRGDGRPGRLKLEVRRALFEKLKELEAEVSIPLISSEEEEALKELWAQEVK